MSEQDAPYGEEWKKEISKLPKSALVALAATLGKENEQLIDKLSPLSSNLFLDLMRDPRAKNEDGMPIVMYVDKPNGGNIIYFRYDAVIKQLNTILKS